MPITIGAQPESGFHDPMGLLTGCHRRMERFLSVLVQLGGQTALGAEQRASLETALRYQLFPLAAVVLEEPQRAAMGGEMEARRGLRRG